MLLAKILKGDRGGQVFLLLLLATLVAVPILNALPPEHALHLPTYLVTLLGKYLTYALLAISVDLVWGFMGILSLGHAAFFGLGGYAMGMYLMRQIGDRGVYGNPELPDFMVFLNWQELPWFWFGFDQLLLVEPTTRSVPSGCSRRTEAATPLTISLSTRRKRSSR